MDPSDAIPVLQVHIFPAALAKTSQQRKDIAFRSDAALLLP